MPALLLVVAAVMDVGLLQGCIHSLLALSVVLTLLSLDFPDLSIEGSFPFGAAIGAVLLADAHLAPLVALGVVAVGGFTAGAVTGFLHVKFQMSKLLSGISVAAMLYSASLLVMGGRAGVPLLERTTFFTPFEAVDKWFNSAATRSASLFLHPGSLAAAALVAVLVLFAVNRLLLSEFGTVLRAVGVNEPALAHYGRSAGGFKIGGVALANALAALAGALSAQFQGFADVNMGIGVIASSLLAVVLGQEIFSRLHIQIDRPTRVTLSALIGAVVYQTLTAAIMAAGAPPSALRFLSGFCLVLVLALRGRRAQVSFSW